MSSHYQLSSAAPAEQSAKWPVHDSLNHLPVHTPVQRCPETTSGVFQQQAWQVPLPIAPHLNGFSPSNNIYRQFSPHPPPPQPSFSDSQKLAQQYYMSMAASEENKLETTQRDPQWVLQPPPPPPSSLTLPLAERPAPTWSPSKNLVLGAGSEVVWRRPPPRNHNDFSGQPSPIPQSPSPVLVLHAVPPTSVVQLPSPRALSFQHVNVSPTSNTTRENEQKTPFVPLKLRLSEEASLSRNHTENVKEEPKTMNGNFHVVVDETHGDDTERCSSTEETVVSSPVIETPQAQYLSVLHYEPRQLSELSAAHAAKQQKSDDERPDTSIEADFDNSPSSLLLNFSQQSITAAAISAVTAAEQNRIAALRIEEKIASEARGFPLPSPIPISSSSSFCRPPGHGPTPVTAAMSNSGQHPLVCNICGFSCNSKFHYNSHMNTHGDHQCSMCDYTSRTEGRLKKHMKESHTIEQQIAAGLEVDQTNEPPPTMVETQSVMDSTPSALDHIRALTEKANLLPESNLSAVSTLATALCAVSQSAPGMIVSNMDLGPSSSQATGETRRSSGNKPKTYKCKQCTHISISKEEQWAHARTHIPVEKQLACPQCDFVTEYKHHLEYHLRNHFGSKPFQCKKCAYACVNKSMLNSHMKSHTNVYQFRCIDCTYATKYCHSLKLHLRKYAHRRVPDSGGDDSMRMSDPLRLSGSLTRSSANEGSSSPMPSMSTAMPQTLASIINPIVTSQSFSYASQVSQALIRQQQQITQMELMRLNQDLNCSMCDYKALSRDEMVTHLTLHLNNHPLTAFYMQQLPQLPLMQPTTVSGSSSETGPRGMSEEHIDRSGSEDHELSGNSPCEGSGLSSGSPMESDAKASGDEACSSGIRGLPNGARKRKAKAFKLDQISQRLQGKTSPTPEDSPEGSRSMQTVETDYAALVAQVPGVSSIVTSEHQLSVFQQLAQISALQQERHRLHDDPWKFACLHCKMAFQDQALYHIHMGYHGFENPFKCNRCGQVADNSLLFNLHLWQAKHD